MKAKVNGTENYPSPAALTPDLKSPWEPIPRLAETTMAFVH